MYEEDARAFAVALYLDHGFSYDEIAFLLRDSRKFMGDRPSGGGGNSQGPVAATIQEQDEGLEQLDGAVDRIHGMAEEIHGELSAQARMLDDMEDELDETTEKMNFVMGKLSKLLKTKDTCQLWTIVALTVVLIVMVFLVIYS